PPRGLPTFPTRRSSDLASARVNAIVSFQNVSYRIGNRTLLDGLSFELHAGETLVLLGRSGSGKTTALKMVNDLLRPTSGKVLVEDRKSTRLNSSHQIIS